MDTLSPALAVCATHAGTAATFSCERCGAFACEACRSAGSGAHCTSCAAREGGQLDVGQALVGTLQLLTRRPAVVGGYVGLQTLVTVLLHPLVGEAQAQLGTGRVSELEDFLALAGRLGAGVLLGFLAYALLVSGLVRALADSAEGRGRPLPELVQGAAGLFLPMLAFQFLHSLVLVAGSLLFLLPALFLVVALFPAPAALVLERLGPVAVFSRAWQLTRGHRLPLLGVLLACVAVGAVLAVGNLGVSFGFASRPLLASVLSTAVMSLAYALYYAATVQVYRQLAGAQA